MEAKTQQKIDSWINGNYDQQTKEEIKKLAQENTKE